MSLKVDPLSMLEKKAEVLSLVLISLQRQILAIGFVIFSESLKAERIEAWVSIDMTTGIVVNEGGSDKD